jgi:DNA uptake protein ComE-like DNA-binding protein
MMEDTEMKSKRILLLASAAVLAVLLGARVDGQVGKGIMDLNSMSEADLLKLPALTPIIAKGIIDKRPFATIVDANAYLTSQGLTAEQTAAIYGKAFVHLNLNTATAPEILLVPRIAGKMAHEFEEYRPWKNWAQFDRDIGKYVTATPGELERLKMYVFIPIDLNTATDEVFMTIPGVGANLVREFKEYRPWRNKEQFEREIGKYVPAKEVARLWRYMVIQ